ncbi:hypothetical protein F8M41_017024 [Gigaspora margarita]|uniref:Uncharacterized protein n=1 Tax=Gigaspora margarita TaxID=4874 RepID=A0A8H4EMB5_GIGMA|nr:hypothetical protein F8M41_017024 [Gigaspora margarita]
MSSSKKRPRNKVETSSRLLLKKLLINTKEPSYKDNLYYEFFNINDKWNLLSFLQHLRAKNMITNPTDDHRLYKHLLDQILNDDEQSETWRNRAKACRNERSFKKQLSKAVDELWKQVEEERQALAPNNQFEGELDHFSKKLKEKMQVQFIKYFESILKKEQEENAQDNITILLKRKILLISGSETFINPTIINEEFNGIPSVKDIPLLNKNILSELNKMETFKSCNDFSIWVRRNFYSFVDSININLSEDEPIFVDYIFDALFHFSEFFGEHYTEPRTESDLQTFYVIPLLKLIKKSKIQFYAVEYRQTIDSIESWPKAIKMVASWELNGFEMFFHETAFFHKDLFKKTYKDLETPSVYMRDDLLIYWKNKFDELQNQFVEIVDPLSTLRSWGMITLGPRGGRSGYHCEIYAMRQAIPGYFIWVLINWSLLPHANMESSCRNFSKPLEVMLRLALRLKEVQRTMNQLDDNCTKIRLEKIIRYT